MSILKVLLHGREITELTLEIGREFTFGRAASCDVQLEAQAGISRTHFRIFHDGQAWRAEVLAKFGHLISGGQPVPSLVLEDGGVFKLVDYDFRYVEVAVAAEESEQSYAAASGEAISHSRAMVATSAAIPLAAVENFEGNDEVTRVVGASSAVPHLRFNDSAGSEKLTPLTGKETWIVGREPSCDIVISDRKASRKQFELTVSSQGCFVRDLGSSNGTSLNGEQLQPDALKPIKSGDVLQIGQLTIHFELRDPGFAEKVMVLSNRLPPVALPQPPAPLAIAPPATYEIVGFPTVQQAGGAVRLPSVNNNGFDGAYPPPDGWADPAADARRKKMRFYLIAAAVLVPLIAFLAMDDKKPAKAKAKPPPVVANDEDFARLSPQNQQKVKESFVLGRQYFMQQKLTSAAEQLRIVHELLPKGYENSLAMARECEEAQRQADLLRQLEIDKQKAEEANRTVERNLAECEPIARRTFNLAELDGCLAPTYTYNPGHPKVAEYQRWVKDRISFRDQSTKKKQEYDRLVTIGAGLFQRAQEIEKRGEVEDAIEAYQKHIAANYPDPKGLKARSRQAINKINSSINGNATDEVAAAEAEYAKTNYRAAIDHALVALAHDPKSQRAQLLIARVRKELDLKLRELYEEATISEGIGNLPDAKEKWRRIVDTDHPEGSYYKKAANKLKAYGGM